MDPRFFVRLVAMLGLAACGCSSGTDMDDSSGSGAGAGGVSSATGGSSATAGGSALGGGGAAGASSAGGQTTTAGTSATGGQTGTAGTSSAGGQPAVDDDQEPGTWKNVTPPEVAAALKAEQSWGGCQFLFADPVRKSDLYSTCDSLGVWKSSDYGQTWAKINTGVNGDQIVGRTWSGAIDQNPDRDPETFPALYVTLGYGKGGIWKSTSGGVDWVNVWDHNVYKEDGVTDIFDDVGSDINGLFTTDATNADHLICYLHGYWGSGGNSGVFESTDGGGKWIVHGTGYFNFQAHADVAFPLSSSTWFVSHGTTWPHSELYRTTDAGLTWGIVKNDFWIGGWNGAQNRRIGSVVYGEGNPMGITTDEGSTWARVDAAGPMGTNAVTETGYIYVTPGDQDQGATEVKIKRSKVDDGVTWEDVPGPDPDAMDHGCCIGSISAYTMVATYNGEHAVIVTNNMMAGIWRYVEP